MLIFNVTTTGTAPCPNFCIGYYAALIWLFYWSVPPHELHT